MRGIKIDPVSKTITEVDVKSPNSSLKGLYEIIGCDLVELVQLDYDIVLVCDEEGKLKEVKGAFTFPGSGLVIVGVAVVLGGSGNRFKALHENLENFEKIVEWVDPADVPEPSIQFEVF